MRALSLLPLLLLVAVARSDQQVDLVIDRVAIFNSGVACYEGHATVNGNATAELEFRSDQINDILKSLMVRDLDGGRVGVVRYASQDPVEKTLKSFGVDITGKPDLASLLEQLRGQPVAIRGQRAVAGVIIGVEKRKRHIGDALLVEELLTLLTDDGIQRITLDDIGGLRLTNQQVAGELQQALATLARSNDTDRKRVQLRFEGQGQRRVRVAYLLEAPIWKTSYRLALDDRDVPFLQGWATVENPTRRDWNGVRLSLISGRPISFRMDLYTPIYIPRPIEELDLYASLRPPEYAAGQARQQEAPIIDISDLRDGAWTTDGLSGSAAGGASFVYATDPNGHTRPTRPSASVRAGARAAGELFQYDILAPVTLPRQQSAMLPIINRKIEGRKLSIFNPATHPTHPLNGLELTNASGLHLMQGPVTVFEDNVYAGDAKLPDLQPNAKRLIAYALDLATEVTTSQKTSPTRMTALRIVEGTLLQTNRYIDEREYLLRNKGDRDRTILVEQPFQPGWELVTPEQPCQKTRRLLRFEVEVPAGETVALPVRLERTGDESVTLTNIASGGINYWVQAEVASPAVRQALAQVIRLKQTLSRATTAREAAEAAYAEATAEQARIRANLKTLRESGDAYRRQIDKFERLEIEIEETRDRVKALKADEAAAQIAVDDFLRNLNVE